MNILLIVGAVVAAIVIIGLLVTCCYVKAIPTEAVVVTGAGHKEPKFVTGRGVLVLPFIQRYDKIIMKILKLDVKTPPTGVKTSEGVPLWIDSVVTVQVYSNASTITDNEVKEAGCKDRDEFIHTRQRAAISNFLGAKEGDFNDKVNDILQGNLREIVAEMTVMDVLTKRKEFAVRVMENAKPDLAKVGLEVVTFNIQDVQDAVDGCGKKHGVVEAIGTQREMEITREAEVAKANARRDIEIAQAEAERESAEKRAIAETKMTEARTEQTLRESELKAQADKAIADAEAAGRIQEQLQEKVRREAEADVEIAAQAKSIEIAEKEAEIEQRKLDAEVRKKADAAKYSAQQKADAERYTQEQQAAADKKKRELDAEATLFEIQKQAEAKKIAAEAELEAAKKHAQAVEAAGKAEAEATRAKAIAEAEGIEKKAIAMQKYGQAAMIEMIVNALPEMAKAIAEPFGAIDNISIIDSGNGEGGVSSMGTYVPGALAKTIQAVKETTGFDLVEVMKAHTYDATVNRNVNITGLDDPEVVEKITEIVKEPKTDN